MAENYVLLETIELSQTAASVTFDNIPQTGYTDLKVVHSSRVSSTDSPVLVNFNGVTTGYSWRRIYGSGSAATSSSNTDGYFVNVGTSAFTASVFANGELYIPNYTSSVAKSISAQTVSENNATLGEAFSHAIQWNPATQAAITSISMTPLSGSFIAFSTFSLYGVAALNTTPVTAPFASGGNIVANDGTYWYHAFLSSGTFTPFKALSCDVLVIAGGGGGGENNGGGGAGGLLYSASQSLTAINHFVIVGAGGGGGSIGSGDPGIKGSDSQFGSITASIGGGRGGSGGSQQVDGGDGGSGGGAKSAGTVVGVATAGQGNNGGTGTYNSGNFPGGGGGGAGAVGGSAPNANAAGNGGAGVNTYSNWATATTTGVSGYYAGGGGGGTFGGGTLGTGGAGGGGAATVSAIANTGGGGGGGKRSSNAAAGAGGSGIVIVRYTMV